MPDNAKILVIEDDKYIMNFVSIYLRDEGYEPLSATTGLEGLALFNQQTPALVLLDLGLPDIDGMEIIGKIRQRSALPILVLSARSEEREKIMALDLGADDYITKPFHMGELLARIRVAQRRQAQPATEPERIFSCDNLTVNFEKRQILVDGQEVHLTPIEYKLLTLLIENRGRVMTHNRIKGEVWGYDDMGDPGSLRVFMASLRRKIEKDTSHPRFILTQVGVGYRFAEK